MKAIQLTEFGPPENMYWGDYPTPTPRPEEILVQVYATAVNRADTLQRVGKYPPPKGESPVMGLEMAGVVVAKGDRVTHWEIGDQLCGLLGGGGYATHCVIHQDLAMPIPQGLSFQEAAAVPEVFLTAFQALVWIGKLQAGESVLIHAGASGVGTAAIQIAKKIGAKVFVTASKGKHELCYQLGAEQCIDYKSESFSDRILKLTNGQGVDLIIDFIGADYFTDNIKSLAIDGRMVMLAFLGGIYPERVNLGPILRKRLSIHGSTLRARRLEYKIELSRAMKDFLWEDFVQAKIKPIIDSTFPIEKAGEAHAKMEANKNQGKIILRIT